VQIVRQKLIAITNKMKNLLMSDDVPKRLLLLPKKLFFLLLRVVFLFTLYPSLLFSSMLQLAKSLLRDLVKLNISVNCPKGEMFLFFSELSDNLSSSFDSR